MDNITHSLAGLLLVDGVLQLRAKQLRAQRMRAADASPDHAFRTVAALTGVIGANLPDSDVPWHAALQAFGSYDELSSLLHHRGYTHSLLAALIWIPLLWGSAVVLCRWHTRRTAAGNERVSDRRSLFLLSALAVLSHTLLDFTNDYGVHPLSPFSNRWMYGDSVFIIEPWLWVIAVPALLRNTALRATRVALVSILVLGLTLCWIVPQIVMPVALIVTIGAVGWMFLAARMPGSAVTGIGLAMWLGVSAMFASGSAAARKHVVAAAQRDTTRATHGGDAFQMLDVIISPMPANPFCSRAITVDASAARYRLTTAWAVAAPTLVSAAWCARATTAATDRGAEHLRMHRTAYRNTDAVAWGWTWSADRTDLADLAQHNCQVAAWLRFARAPFWMEAGSDSVTVGDLRYDRDRGVRVARFTFAKRPTICPASVPPWRQPRRDVWPGLGQ